MHRVNHLNYRCSLWKTEYIQTQGIRKERQLLQIYILNRRHFEIFWEDLVQCLLFYYCFLPMTTQIIQSAEDEILNVRSFPWKDAKIWLTYNPSLLPIHSERYFISYLDIVYLLSFTNFLLLYSAILYQERGIFSHLYKLICITTPKFHTQVLLRNVCKDHLPVQFQSPTCAYCPICRKEPCEPCAHLDCIYHTHTHTHIYMHIYILVPTKQSLEDVHDRLFGTKHNRFGGDPE